MSSPSRPTVPSAARDAPWRRVAAEIEALASPGGRERLGACSVEGTRLVERALRAGARLERAVTTRAFLEDASPRTTALRGALDAHGCELVVAPDDAMERLTDGRKLGGIVAHARLPRPGTLDELAGERARAVSLLACVSFNDPGNVGALVRTAHGSGAAAVLAVGATDAFHPKAVRTSMGSIFRVPIVTLPDVPTMVAALRALDVVTIGTVTEGGVPLPRFEAPANRVAVVMGSEAFGLGDGERAHLDQLVTIPMSSEIDSFSVNAAAAIALYELGRRRAPSED